MPDRERRARDTDQPETIEREGPDWAWELQDVLDENLQLVGRTLAVLALAGTTAYAVSSSWAWICSWWWWTTPYGQSWAIGGLGTGIYGLGVAMGYWLSDATR